MARRILLIEDDGSVVEFLRAYLGDEGYEIVVAEDGLAGLLKLRASRPDLAVVDIMMPDVDGVRVLDQLLEEGNRVPVVVITGSPAGAQHCRQLLDPADVIEKPFEPEELLDRIHAHLGATT
jgi:DNA-binding response OmpR family regulator